MSTKSKSKVKVKDLKPKKDAIGGTRRASALHASGRSAALGSRGGGGSRGAGGVNQAQ